MNILTDNALKYAPEGSTVTIGLSIAKAIVEAHRGTIRAWSQDGHSFNITCVFPG